MQGLKVDVYMGIEERTNVRHLVDGIKNEKIDSVKTQIMANQALRNSYPKYVTLFKHFILEMNNQNTKYNSDVSSTMSDPAQKTTYYPMGKYAGMGRSNEKVQDRYYTVKEYDNMSYKDKAELNKLRNKRKKRWYQQREQETCQV